MFIEILAIAPCRRLECGTMLAPATFRNGPARKAKVLSIAVLMRHSFSIVNVSGVTLSSNLAATGTGVAVAILSSLYQYFTNRGVGEEDRDTKIKL